METLTAKREAIDAIVRYAREVAQLPPFPIRVWRPTGLGEGENEPPTTILKAMATDKITGEVLPRTCDSWLALLPFDDLGKHTPTQDLIQKRRAFMEILATVAQCGAMHLRFDASSSMRRTGESQESACAENTFWSDLMRELDPEADQDTSREMARCLIALSHTQSLRFLLSVSLSFVPANFPEMLEQLLQPLPDPALTASANTVLTACGVVSTGSRRKTVELALSFSNAKISPSLLSKVLDVIDRCSQRRAVGLCGVELRVTSLRFGRKCVLQPKAVEILGQHRALSSITDLRLGDLHSLKPIQLRLGIKSMICRPSGLRRFTATTESVFQAAASTLRSGASSLEELDVVYKPTIENAAWLAFALFHVDSTSSVCTLRLHVPHSTRSWRFGDTETDAINNVWLTAFKRALPSVTADQDLAYLEGGDGRDVSDRQRRMVSIKAGTPVKAEPYASAKLQYKVESEADVFEVIATVNNSLAVIVPGLGIGWVPSAGVTSEQFPASRLSLPSDGFQTNGKITTLVWDCATHGFYNQTRLNTTNVLLEILEIVGRPIKRLHLPGLQFTTDDLTHVLAFCPNLEDLNINGHAMSSIAPLVTAYEIGGCKIQTLNVVGSRGGVNQDDIPRELATLLGGSGGDRLRRLAVHVAPLYTFHSATPTPSKQDIAALVRSLGSSNTLELMDLPGLTRWAPVWQIPHYGHTEASSPTSIEVDVSEHPFCVSSMPLSSKLAFLSCLERQDANSALHRLDACVLAVIFRFSACRITRQVITDAPFAHMPTPNPFVFRMGLL